MRFVWSLGLVGVYIWAHGHLFVALSMLMQSSHLALLVVLLGFTGKCTTFKTEIFVERCFTTVQLKI